MMASLSGIQHISAGLAHGVPSVHGPGLDKVMLLGFLSSFFAIVCYFHRRYSKAFEVGLAMGLAGMAGYAFLQDAWPIGIAEAIWSAHTLSGLRKRSESIPAIQTIHRNRIVQPAFHFEMESRLSRMFGRN